MDQRRPDRRAQRPAPHPGREAGAATGAEPYPAPAEAGAERRRDRLTAGAFLLTASAWAIGVVWLRSHRHIGYPSNDIYAYFYPNVLHVEQSLRHGAGLLWNPYQDCGQPFFGVSQTGLLYPLNAIFLLLPREPALIASLAAHLFIAGAAFYVLCRELSLEPFAALSGALVFQLAGTTVQLGSWNPTIIATYAWMPVALWSTERLLKRPTARGAICLGSILTVQLLPGYPQILFFTVQLIALRVAWAIVARQTPRPAALAMASCRCRGAADSARRRPVPALPGGVAPVGSLGRARPRPARRRVHLGDPAPGGCRRGRLPGRRRPGPRRRPGRLRPPPGATAGQPGSSI